MYSYHVNATFLRLIPHSTTVATLDTGRQAVRTARSTRSAAHSTSVVSDGRLRNYWRRHFNFSHSVPAGAKIFKGDPKFFYVNPLAPSWATNSWKRNSKIAHQSRDIGVKPYIKNPFFPSYEKRCLQIFDILGGLMCSTKLNKLR